MINIQKKNLINYIYNVNSSNIAIIFLKSLSTSASEKKGDEKIIYNEDLFKKPPEDEKKFHFKTRPEDKDLDEINDNTVRSAVINARSFFRDSRGIDFNELGYSNDFIAWVLSRKTPLFWDMAFIDATEEFNKELVRNNETIITLDETKAQEMITKHYLYILLELYNEEEEIMRNRPEFLKIEDEKAYQDIWDTWDWSEDFKAMDYIRVVISCGAIVLFFSYCI